MQVSQMINNRGNSAANQFIISTEKGIGFQSYQSMIAVKKGGELFLSDKWDYSQTTLKHLKIFMETSLTKAQIQKRIDQGYLKVVSESELKALLGE